MSMRNRGELSQFHWVIIVLVVGFVFYTMNNPRGSVDTNQRVFAPSQEFGEVSVPLKQSGAGGSSCPSKPTGECCKGNTEFKVGVLYYCVVPTGPPIVMNGYCVYSCVQDDSCDNTDVPVLIGEGGTKIVAGVRRNTGEKGGRYGPPTFKAEEGCLYPLLTSS